MGTWDGFDMQAELHPGFVPAACIAEVPGRPLGPVQDFTVEALATVSCVVGCYSSIQGSQSPGKQAKRMLGSTLPLS